VHHLPRRAAAPLSSARSSRRDRVDCYHDEEHASSDQSGEWNHPSISWSPFRARKAILIIRRGGRSGVDQGKDDHPVDSRPERHRHPSIRQEPRAGLAPLREAGAIHCRWRSTAISGSSRGAFGRSAGRSDRLAPSLPARRGRDPWRGRSSRRRVVDESVVAFGDGGFAPLFGAGLSGLTIGAFAFGPLAARLGRPAILALTVLFFGMGLLASAFAPSSGMLILLQFVTGLGRGGAMPNAITLTSEDTVENEIRRSEYATLCSPGGNALRPCFLEQPNLVGNRRIVDVADGMTQAAGFSLTPSVNLVPRTSSASSGDPFNDRQPFEALSISSNTIVRHAVRVPPGVVLGLPGRRAPGDGRRRRHRGVWPEDRLESLGEVAGADPLEVEPGDQTLQAPRLPQIRRQDRRGEGRSSSGRRSRTRGCLTSMGPTPVWMARSGRSSGGRASPPPPGGS
jgi:hypothetical protein